MSNEEAQLYLARMYHEGEGVEQLRIPEHSPLVFQFEHLNVCGDYFHMELNQTAVNIRFLFFRSLSHLLYNQILYAKRVPFAGTLNNFHTFSQ